MNILKVLFGLGLLLVLMSSFTGCNTDTESSDDPSTLTDDDSLHEDDADGDSEDNTQGTETNPIILTLDTAADGEVDKSGESDGTAYYQFTSTGALAYDVTISNASSSDLQLAIYTGSSSILTSSEEAVFSATDGTEVSIEVINGGTLEATYTITVSEATPKNEGSVEAPISLTLEVAQAATVGTELLDAENSYYIFTTNEAGIYDITASGSSISAYLYSDASFSTLVDSDVWGGDLNLLLDGNTTYYLKIQNEISFDETFELKVAEVGAVNEGEVGSPIPLTLDVTHDAKIGSNDWDLDYSYYSFTTTETAIYVISILNATPDNRLDFDIYLDINFSDLFGGVDNYARTTARLDGNTTYYMKVYNYYGSDDMTYDLTIIAPNEFLTLSEDQNTSDAPVNLETDIQYTAHVGTSTTGGENSYYKYTTGETDEIIFTAFTNTSPSADIDLYVYSDSSYSNQIEYSDTAPLWMMMDANTTYYIRILNYSNSDDVNFSLLLQPDPQ